MSLFRPQPIEPDRLNLLLFRLSRHELLLGSDFSVMVVDERWGPLKRSQVVTRAMQHILTRRVRRPSLAASHSGAPARHRRRRHIAMDDHRNSHIAARHFRRIGAMPIALLVAWLAAASVFMDTIGAGASSDSKVPMTPMLAASYTVGKLVAQDNFVRTSTRGLGTAKLGGTYAGSPGKSVFSVRGGQAIVANLRPATGSEQHLPNSAARDAQMQTTLHVASVSTATIGLHYSNEFRRQANGDRYDISVLLYANGQVNLGAVAVNSGVTRRIGKEIAVLRVGSNENLTEQAQIVGTNPTVLRARVWLQGTAAPNWQFVATDSGNSAITHTGVSGLDLYEASNGTVTRYAFAGLAVWNLNAPVTSPKPRPRPGKPIFAPPAPSSSHGPGTGSTVASNAATNLDSTGRTIPNTDYPIPAGAIFMSPAGSPNNSGAAALPVSTLNAAIGLVRDGGTIVVESGVYRDWYHNKRDSFAIFGKAFTLQAAPHAQVWFDGSDVEPGSNWSSDGSGHWTMPWSTPSFCGGAYYAYAYNHQPTSNTGPCSHYDMTSSQYPASADPQMVFVNGTQLTEVTSLSQVTAGTFYYAQDLANRTGRMYIGTDPSTSTVELSARPTALVTGASNFNIKGIGFRRYATNEYSNNTTAAVYDCCGRNMLVQDSVFTQNASMGLMMGSTNGRVEHSVFTYNGGQGLGSSGHQSSTGAWDGLVFDSNLVSYNNTAHMGFSCSLSCDQSGLKMTHMDGFTVSNNIFEYNAGGPGVWCDESCNNGEYLYNVSHDNKTGIFDEVSSGDIIASNLTYNNAEYGIRISSYGDKIYNNTAANNGSDDLWIYDDPRNAQNLQGTEVGPDTNNLMVANNIFSGGGSGGIARFQRSNSNQTNTGPNTWFSVLDYNTYYRSSSSAPLVSWIDTTNAGDYTTLAQLRKAHGLEAHGQDISNPARAGQAQSNVRARAITVAVAVASGTTLPVDVASALGVPASAGTDRGVIFYPGG